jgi:hypothetical protein
MTSEPRHEQDEDVDQDSEPTNTAPPGERPTDPGPIAEAQNDSGSAADDS